MAEQATIAGIAIGGAPIQLGVLGPLTVTTPSGPYVPRGRLRALVAWLALLAPAGASPERLAELLWAEEALLYPHRQLQVLLHQLRRSLGTSAVAVSRTKVGLARGSADVDAERFTTLLCGDLGGTALGPAAVARKEALRAALSLWRGSPYPEIADHHEAVGVIRRLTRAHVLAVGELACIRLAGGEPPADVVADLYPAMTEGEADGAALQAVVALGLALGARRVEALRALGALQPGDDGQRAWRADTEQAIRIDDIAALTRQLEDLRATISATWPTLTATEPASRLFR